MNYENGNRELGELTAHIENLRDAISRVEGKQDAIMGKVPEFQSRLDDHQRQIDAQWKKWDDLPNRVYALVGVVGIVAGGVVWIVEKLNGG